MDPELGCVRPKPSILDAKRYSAFPHRTPRAYVFFFRAIYQPMPSTAGLHSTHYVPCRASKGNKNLQGVLVRVLAHSQ